MRTTTRTRRGIRLVAAALALLLVAGACSSDTDPEVAGEQQTATADEQTAAVDGGEPAADGEVQPGIPVASGDGAAPAGGDAPVAAPTGGANLEGAELEEYLARRYEAYWDAYDAARSAPTANPSVDFPQLGALAAGEQLDISYQSVIELAEKGEAIREPDTAAIAGNDANTEHRVRIDVIDGTVAEISGCVVNDDVRHVVGSGDVIRDSVATVMSTSTMALTDGEWKLIRSRAVEIDEGVTGCWLTDEATFPY